MHTTIHPMGVEMMSAKDDNIIEVLPEGESIGQQMQDDMEYWYRRMWRAMRIPPEYLYRVPPKYRVEDDPD